MNINYDYHFFSNIQENVKITYMLAQVTDIQIVSGSYRDVEYVESSSDGHRLQGGHRYFKLMKKANMAYSCERLVLWHHYDILDDIIKRHRLTD